MKKQQAVKKLAELGWEFDWDVTGKHPVWSWWSGTIDPIGKMTWTREWGGCGGLVVEGATAADMYKDAVERATEHELFPCDDPDCDMHSEIKS